MLDEQDIKKIGEEVGKVIEDNINPRFDALENQMGGIEGRMGGIEVRVGGIEGRMDMLEKTISNLPTKAYLDDKLADLEGGVIVRQRKEDERARLMISFLEQNKLLSDAQIAELRQFQIFVAPPKVG